MSPRSVGDTSIRELPARDKDFNADGIREVVRFEGPHADLEAQRPANGSLHSETGLLVERTSLRRTNGGDGILTLFLSNQFGGSDGGGTTAADPVWEQDWVVIQKPLLEHPRYQAGGAKALDATDLNAIAAWNVAPHGLKKDYKFQWVDATGEVTEETLGANAQDYAGKILRGTTHYRLYLPVLRKTTYSRAKPTGAAAGTLPGSKPDTMAPDGYTWIKSAYKIRRKGARGVYQVYEEWSGLDKIDTDLYPVVS